LKHIYSALVCNVSDNVWVSVSASDPKSKVSVSDRNVSFTSLLNPVDHSHPIVVLTSKRRGWSMVWNRRHGGRSVPYEQCDVGIKRQLLRLQYRASDQCAIAAAAAAEWSWRAAIGQ